MNVWTHVFVPLSCQHWGSILGFRHDWVKSMTIKNFDTCSPIWSPTNADSDYVQRHLCILVSLPVALALPSPPKLCQTDRQKVVSCAFILSFNFSVHLWRAIARFTWGAHHRLCHGAVRQPLCHQHSASWKSKVALDFPECHSLLLNSLQLLG